MNAGRLLHLLGDVETVQRALRMLEGVANVIGAADYDPITDAFNALNRIERALGAENGEQANG